MAEINDLNVTDASNTARFPENQLPSTVNNGARALEGIIARWDKDTNGSLTPGGTADVITIAANQTLSAYYDGLVIAFEAAGTNTGAVTVNVDALGAKSIVKPDGSAMAAGDIVSGSKVIIIYDGTNFQIVSFFADTAQYSLSEEWATKITGVVADSEYSSKAYAIGGTGVTDTAGKGAAKEWATAAEDDLVDGSEYSAKHYSIKSNASAVAAAASETAASNSETAAAASETAAGVSETNAAASEAAAAASAQGWADVVSITAGTTNIEITDANKYYILDASGGSITMNLPAVGVSDGLTLAFEVLDASNSITIARDGTDTINGLAADYTSLTGVGDVVYFISIDGTPDNWSARLISRFVVDGSTITQSGRTISVGTGGVDTTQLADDGVTPAKVSGSVNAQTGTSYTLILGDAFKTVTMSNASANTLTIPTNASVAFSAGDRIDVIMKGAGVTTITGDTGVTVNGVSAGSGDLAQYGAASLLKVDTNTWLAVGLETA
jgi:hypothetical protein